MCGHLVVHLDNKVTPSFIKGIVSTTNHSIPKPCKTKEAHFYYEPLSVKCKRKIEFYHLIHG